MSDGAFYYVNIRKTDPTTRLRKTVDQIDSFLSHGAQDRDLLVMLLMSTKLLIESVINDLEEKARSP